MRLIDGDALMELYTDRLTVVAERYSPDSSECGILSGAMKLLEIQPTIEIVRCGECKHSYDAIGGTFCSYGTCVDCVVGVDFFCSNGERRADDETD